MRQVDNKVFEKIAKKYNISGILVRSICTYPFLFSKKIMEDPEDEKPIMLFGLFKIKLKNMFIGKKNAPYSKTKAKIINEKKKEVKDLLI